MLQMAVSNIDIYARESASSTGVSVGVLDLFETSDSVIKMSERVWKFLLTSRKFGVVPGMPLDYVVVTWDIVIIRGIVVALS